MAWRRFTNYLGLEGVLVFGVALTCGTFGALPSATAEENPFGFDPGGWVSTETFDRHSTKKPPAPPEAPEPAAEERPTDPPPELAAPHEQQTPASNGHAISNISAPTLPTLRKGAEIIATSTEEDKIKAAESEAAALLNKNLLDDGWRDISSSPQSINLQEDDQDHDHPLDVRMTFLPLSNITKTPSPERESARTKGHRLLRELTAPKKKEPEKAEAAAAACAALEAYKRQQLEAIQIDRETLSALQNAIEKLGYEKELGFITKEGSQLQK